MNNANAAILPGKAIAKSKKSTKTRNAKKKSLAEVTLAKIIIAILVVLLLASGIFVYFASYQNKILPKVTIAGIKVGGMTLDDAKLALSAKVNELNENGPKITYTDKYGNDRTLEPNLDEMGISFNVDDAINAGYQFGRANNLSEKINENIKLLTGNHEIEISPKIDEQKFESFIDQIDKNVKIPARDKQVEDGTNKILDEGQDGLEVDKEALASQIKDTISNGTSSAEITVPTKEIKRTVTTIYPHAMPGRYPGRYIDINLSEQTLYAFEGKNQIASYLVSTGRSGYATPTGEFHIYGQDRYALMDGPDYYLPNVPYVSWFYGDYSIHGTYWHHNFGHVMSHGCVNMETGAAEWVYNWAEVGTPVYIHY